MSDPSIVLHQWLISPFCAKVRKYLEAKGLPFEVREYNGLLAVKAKMLSKAGKLPVLDYAVGGGEPERIQDSSAIIRFLEERHPDPPLWPEDPREAALAHLLEDWADESLFWYEAYFRMEDPVASRKAGALLGAGRPAWEGLFIRKAGEITIGRSLRGQGLAKRSEAQIERELLGHLDAIEALLTGRPWLVGDRQSIADLAVAAQLGEFVRTSRFADEIRSRSTLVDWLERNPG